MSRENRVKLERADAKDVIEKLEKIFEKTQSPTGSPAGVVPAPRPAGNPGEPQAPAQPASVTIENGTGLSEDTIVVDDRGFEVGTEAQDWPKVEVTVKGYTLPRPGILER